MTLLHTRSGATGFSHPDFGDFDVAEDGTVNVPDELARQLLATRVDGVEQWETDIDHRSRLLDEERDRRKDPATLLAEVEKLTSERTPGSAEHAPSDGGVVDVSSLSDTELERLLAERRSAAGLPPLVEQQQAELPPPSPSITENEHPEEGIPAQPENTPAGDGDLTTQGEPERAPEGDPAEEHIVPGVVGSAPTAPLPVGTTTGVPLQEAEIVTHSDDERAAAALAKKIAESDKRVDTVAAAIAADDYDELHVPELQALAAERGLDSSGVKADLVGRLRDKDAGAASQPK